MDVSHQAEAESTARAKSQRGRRKEERLPGAEGWNIKKLWPAKGAATSRPPTRWDRVWKVLGRVCVSIPAFDTEMGCRWHGAKVEFSTPRERKAKESRKQRKIPGAVGWQVKKSLAGKGRLKIAWTNSVPLGYGLKSTAFVDKILPKNFPPRRGNRQFALRPKTKILPKPKAAGSPQNFMERKDRTERLP